MNDNIFIGKHCIPGHPELITIGIKGKDKDGNIVGHTTTIDAEYFFKLVEKVKKSDSAILLEPEDY
jgi:hypothetical protein